MTEQKAKEMKVKKNKKPQKVTKASAPSVAAVDSELESTQEIQAKPMGKRTPIHSQKAGGFKARPGFTARQIVEKPGRVEQYLEGGYIIAQGQHRMESDGRIQDAKGLGDACRVVVNKHNLSAADCATAVYVEIPTELYEQDQLDKLKKTQLREDQIDPKKLEEQNPDVYYGSKFNKSYE